MTTVDWLTALGVGVSLWSVGLSYLAVAWNRRARESGLRRVDDAFAAALAAQAVRVRAAPRAAMGNRNPRRARPPA